MSSLPAHLELIVADLHAAAERSLVRRRRGRRLRVGLAAVAVCCLAAAAVAGATGGFDYLDLVRLAYPDARVSDLGDRQQRLLASLPEGTADVIRTDLGVTNAAADGPPGTSTCDFDEDARILECALGPGRVTIPAGTHVYRLQPGPDATVPAPEASVMYVPAYKLELVVDPAPARP